MRIVELYRDFIREQRYVHIFHLETPNNILYRGRDQKKLLFQTQFPALKKIIIGIEYFCNVFTEQLIAAG